MPNNSYPHTDIRLEKEYFINWKSGATGAVPTTLTRDRGIVSVTHNGVGKFTIVVKRNGADVTNFVAWVEQATPALTGACDGVMWSQNVNTAGGGIVVQFINAAGAATDPTTNDVVKVKFAIKHSAGLV